MLHMFYWQDESLFINLIRLISQIQLREQYSLKRDDRSYNELVSITLFYYEVFNRFHKKNFFE